MNLPYPKSGARGGPAFTLIEIALSLTIIAFALIAIIGVLPHGMTVQKDNREETIINQDAIYLMGLLRSGAQGADDLTNYVTAIVVRTNNAVELDYVNPWLTPPTSIPLVSAQQFKLTNGPNIVGLMSIPRYLGSATNQVTVYMRAISGNAADKPPQTDPLVRDLAFSYRVTAEVTPYFSKIDTNLQTAQQIAISQNLQTNLYDLRLTFRWPLFVNGTVGSGKLSFRTMVSGGVVKRPVAGLTWLDLYFLQPSTFAVAQPPIPLAVKTLFTIQDRRSLRAFTLVEMLVVMLLLSVIVFGLMAMFSETQKAFRQSLTQTDVLEGGRPAADLIARDLGSMVPSYTSNTMNFYAEIANLNPVGQGLPGTNSIPRTNALENVYCLTRQNQKWGAYGYFFTNVSDGVGTLFRYSNTGTNINSDPHHIFADFLQQTNTVSLSSNNFNSVSRLLDGVVEFRIRTFYTNGTWIAPFTNVVVSAYTNMLTIWASNAPPLRVFSEVGLYRFTSNALPAYVEFELGILEKRVYERFKALRDPQARADFLSRQIGAVHVFRQRVPVRAVDVSAYQ